jgi:hypothetical protein
VVVNRYYHRYKLKKTGVKHMSGHIIYVWDATNHGQPQSFDAAILTFQKLITDIPEQPTSAMLPNWLIK